MTSSAKWYIKKKRNTARGSKEQRKTRGLLFRVSEKDLPDEVTSRNEEKLPAIQKIGGSGVLQAEQTASAKPLREEENLDFVEMRGR